MALNIPVGISNFTEIRSNNYYYVDKTLFIKEVLNEKVALYTRPRRFHRIVSRYLWYPTRGALVAGKTLNMSRRCPPRRAILFLFYERERECVSF